MASGLRGKTPDYRYQQRLVEYSFLLERMAGLRVYADDRLWASFAATDLNGGPPQSMDKIFVFPGTDLIPVADASPGSPGYHGGRWEVHAVAFTGMAPRQFTNDEQVWYFAGLGQLSIGGVVKYFECPLIRL